MPTEWTYNTDGLDTGTCVAFSWMRKQLTLEGVDGARETYHFDRHAQVSSFMRWHKARHDNDMIGVEITVQYEERDDGKRYEITFSDK